MSKLYNCVRLFNGLKWKTGFAPSFLDPQSWITASTTRAAQCCWRGNATVYFISNGLQELLCGGFLPHVNCPAHSVAVQPNLLFISQGQSPPPSDSEEGRVYVTEKMKTIIFNSKYRFLCLHLFFPTIWWIRVPILSQNRPSHSCPWFHLLPLTGSRSRHDHNSPASPVLCPQTRRAHVYLIAFYNCQLICSSRPGRSSKRGKD